MTWHACDGACIWYAVEECMDLDEDGIIRKGERMVCTYKAVVLDEPKQDCPHRAKRGDRDAVAERERRLASRPVTVQVEL